MKPHPFVALLAIVASLVFGDFWIVTNASAKPPSEEKRRGSSQTTEIKGWGKAIDPDGDCQFFLSREALLISVPGSPNPHDLAAETDTTNAPRVLQTVRGDFTAQVQIDGRFAPGEKSTLPGRVGYNGAGIVIMADSENVVCLARAVMNYPGGEPKSYANFEMRVDGELERIGDANVKPLPITGPVFLRLKRAGQKISGAVSTDGKRWEQLTSKELPMEWPKTLSVGVVAISTSTDEFNPRFSKFKIVK